MDPEVTEELAELREALRRATAITGALQEGFVLTDAHDRIIDLNERFCAITGFAREDLLGVGPPYPFHGREALAQFAAQHESLRRGAACDQEMVWQRADGSRVHVHLTGSGAVDAEGRPAGYVSTVADISQAVHERQTLQASEAQLRLLADHSGDLIARHLPWGPAFYVSPAAERVLGRSREVAQGISMWHVCVPEDRPALEAAVERLHRGEVARVLYRLADDDGSVRWLESTLRPICDEDGDLQEFVSVTRDVSARQAVEQAVRDERDHLQAVIGAMHDGFVLVHDGVLAEVNDALCRLTGFSRAELIGARSPFPFWPEDRLDELGEAQREMRDQGSGQFELELQRRDGSRFVAVITVAPVPPPAGVERASVSTVRDITAQALYESELHRLANEDALTGLLNQGRFRELLADETTRALRRERELSVVVMDVDHFKSINDRFGHPVGDAVLTETARRLNAVCRSEERIARVGGEEFAWVLPEADGDGAVIAAERARTAIENLDFGQVGRVTVSVGVCSLADVEDPERLFAHADEALYAAKNAGRNQVCRWRPAPAGAVA